MDFINNLSLFVGGHLWNLVIVLAVLLAITYGLRTNFVQFRHFKDTLNLVFNRSKKKTDKNDVSGLEAVMITLGGAIGTGNVAGVAMAIFYGGPGAVFWMWLIALFGAATSFIENTLGQVYKVRDGDEFRGGPMYYMEQGLKSRTLGLVYAFSMIVSLGFALAALQMNTITLSVGQSFQLPTVVTSGIVALITALIIFGGIKRIATAASLSVPFMTLVYFFLVLLILIQNVSMIPSAFVSIFTNAFAIESIMGAAIGTVIIQGLKRGVFSNGAGQGDAPTAGASSNVSHPAKQGLLGTFAIYVDTLLACTLTAIAVIISQSYLNTDLRGIELAQYSFTSLLGAWSGYVFSICIALFCFTSIMSNYYCGESCLAFMTKDMTGRTLYRIIFVVSIFIGGITSVEVMWNVADMFCAFLVCLNMVSLFFIGKVAVQVGKDYTRQMKEGKDPVFFASSIPGLTDLEHWHDGRDYSNED